MRLATVIFVSLLAGVVGPLSAQDATEGSLQQKLASGARSLHTAGESILLSEAEEHQYFLLGEVHGETEIPALLGELWPELWKAGYRHVAAEVSPWAATHLERPASQDATRVPGLWNREQAAEVNRLAQSHQGVLWGCDIEEEQPEQLIEQLAKLNPTDSRLQGMRTIVGQRYRRARAPELLRLAMLDHPAHDVNVGGASLWESTVNTLKVEAYRSDPRTRYQASDARERVMKELFLRHREDAPEGKVLLRFGRNHLHRGLDARGISTLGNFVAEWALAHGQSVVNVGVFAAGGSEHLMGQTFNADEREDELTFAFLAKLAGSEPTLFDLREIRPLLHAIPAEKRSPLELNLTYWADGYDFLLCYPRVSPLVEDSR